MLGISRPPGILREAAKLESAEAEITLCKKQPHTVCYTISIHTNSLCSFARFLLTRVLHNLTLHLTILRDISTDLLWQWNFLSFIILAFQHDQVDAGSFAGEKLSAIAFFAEVNCCTIYLVHKDSREGASNLKSKIGAFDHVH